MTIEIGLYGKGCPDLGIADCLDCPRQRCRYDSEGKSSRRSPLRDDQSDFHRSEVLRLLAQGLDIKAASEIVGVTTRTAYRYRKAAE